MLDFNHLITRPGVDVQVFTLPSTVTNTQLHPYQKPRGLGRCFCLCIGGGGGGGGGFTRVAGAAGGGGGGGGGGGIARVIFPLDFVPDNLHVQVGGGGAGAVTPGTAGAGALFSALCLGPNEGTINRIVSSSNAGASGGGGGTGAAAGAAGVAAAIPSFFVGSGLGVVQVLGGVIGGLGGAQTGAAGANVALPTSGQCCFGAPGGGGTTSADFAGGGITALASAYLSDVRPIPQAAAGSNPGAHGFTLWKPFFTYPGGGGGSSNTGVGGRGGNGAYGSGGGGGGAGTTGGLGGNGGDGIVIIICW